MQGYKHPARPDWIYGQFDGVVVTCVQTPEDRFFAPRTKIDQKKFKMAVANTIMPNTPQIIMEINKADVLLGRGKRVHLWEGNVAFRSLCEVSAVAYRGANSTAEKEAIVLEVISNIQSNGGRFLREEEITALDGTTHTAWIIVPLSVVRTKIRQACRDAVRIRVRVNKKKPNASNDTSSTIVQRLCTVQRAVHQGDLSAEVGEAFDFNDPTPVAPEMRESSPFSLCNSSEPTDQELLQALLSMYGSSSTGAGRSRPRSTTSQNNRQQKSRRELGVSLRASYHQLPMFQSANAETAFASCQISPTEPQVAPLLHMNLHHHDPLLRDGPFTARRDERHHQGIQRIINHFPTTIAFSPAQEQALTAGDPHTRILVKLINERCALERAASCGKTKRVGPSW